MFETSVPQAITPKRRRLFPSLILVLGIVGLLVGAAFIMVMQSRKEKVVVAIRPVAYGQRIAVADLALLEVPADRPPQFKTWLLDPKQVVGKWAARPIGVNDPLQPGMLLDQPPDQPVYPSGEQLHRNMVALPFSLQTIGPITTDDRVNIGYLDPTGTATRCATGGTARPAAPAGEAYACRVLTGVNVLHIDPERNMAYLEVTPEQSLSIWAMQSADLQLWGERYGATSELLPPLDRLSPSQVGPNQVAAPLPGSTPVTTTSSLGVPGGGQ